MQLHPRVLSDSASFQISFRRFFYPHGLEAFGNYPSLFSNRIQDNSLLSQNSYYFILTSARLGNIEDQVGNDSSRNW